MPSPSEAARLKGILAGLGLFHNDIKISNQDDDFRPTVVGAPGSADPPVANIGTTQHLIPGASGPDPQMAPLAAANAYYDAHPPKMQKGLVATLGSIINALDNTQTGEYLQKGTFADDAVKGYLTHGPQALASSARDLGTQYTESMLRNAPQGRGVPIEDVAPQVRGLAAAGGMTAAPMALPMAAMAPAAAVVGGIGSTALAGGAEHLALKAGMSPEKAGLVGEAAGFVSPEHALAAVPFAAMAGKKAILAAVEKESAAKVTQMLADNPELGKIVRWMHPSETVALAKMTPAAQAEFLRVHSALPKNELLGAVARAGGEKLGWYEHSRAAIQHVFGTDADLFAGILAATSPQNSVEMNLRNATQIYRGWVQANRPTDDASILKIMADNVLGEKGEKSVLDAWKNNTIAVLKGGDTLSGPKVDSFWRNLRNRAVETPHGAMRPEDAVTLDAWMSNVLGIQQTYFSGGGAKFAEKNPGYGPGYLASAAKIREAATAHGMTPEQMQETIWSWGKALYEQSEKTKIPAVDIVKNGTLDPAAVTGTPDFSTLFQHPDYADAIRGSSKGHAERLASLKAATFPKLGAANPADQKWQLEAAKVLDNLRASRDLASDMRTGQNAPGTVGINIMQEGMTGSTTRVAPELATDAYTQNQRDAFARQLLHPNTDVRGENVLLKVLGMPTTETTVGLGQWTPKEGPTQYNTLDAAGVRARIKGAALNEADSKKIITAARLQGLLDAQDAVATTGVVYDQAHKDTLHVFTQNKVKGEVFEGLTKLLPNDYALVNKGGGTPGHVIDVIRLDGQPIGSAEEELIRGHLSQYMKWGSKKGVPVPPKIDITQGSNVAGTYFELPWASGPGSKEVTRAALQHYDELPKAARAALDSPQVKQIAKSKLKFWDAQSEKRGLTVPEDYRRMLQLVSEGGISALRGALDNPEQLVPVLFLLGLGRSVLGTPRTPGETTSS